MQEAFVEEYFPAMTDQRIDLNMLSRIDSEQKDTASRVDDIKNSLHGLEREVSEIKGAIKPPAEIPWWMRFIVAPVCVAAILATGASVIHLEIAVSSIGKNVGVLQSSLTQQTLTSYAALPPNDFKEILSGLSSSIAIARSKNIKVPSKVVDDLSAQLNIAGADASGFWPTAAELISYRSFNNVSWYAANNLKRCVESPPSITKIREVISPTKMIVNPAVYENCELMLDSPEENRILNSYLVGRSPQITFKHCIIVYSGGPISIILAFKDFKAHYRVDGPSPAEGEVSITNDHTLEFHDCLFDFSFRDTPSAQGKELAQILLTTPASDVKLHFSSSS
jgi:hypothetical protein